MRWKRPAGQRRCRGWIPDPTAVPAPGVRRAHPQPGPLGADAAGRDLRRARRRLGPCAAAADSLCPACPRDLHQGLRVVRRAGAGAGGVASGEPDARLPRGAGPHLAPAAPGREVHAAPPAGCGLGTSSCDATWTPLGRHRSVGCQRVGRDCPNAFASATSALPASAGAICRRNARYPEAAASRSPADSAALAAPYMLRARPGSRASVAR